MRTIPQILPKTNNLCSFKSKTSKTNLPCKWRTRMAKLIRLNLTRMTRSLKVSLRSISASLAATVFKQKTSPTIPLIKLLTASIIWIWIPRRVLWERLKNSQIMKVSHNSRIIWTTWAKTRICSWWFNIMRWFSSSLTAKYSLLCLRTNRWKIVLCNKRLPSIKHSNASNNSRTKCSRIRWTPRSSLPKYSRAITMCRQSLPKNWMRQSIPW